MICQVGKIQRIHFLRSRNSMTLKSRLMNRSVQRKGRVGSYYFLASRGLPILTNPVYEAGVQPEIQLLIDISSNSLMEDFVSFIPVQLVFVQQHKDQQHFHYIQKPYHRLWGRSQPLQNMANLMTYFFPLLGGAKKTILEEWDT